MTLFGCLHRLVTRERLCLDAYTRPYRALEKDKYIFKYSISGLVLFKKSLKYKYKTGSAIKYLNKKI